MFIAVVAGQMQKRLPYNQSMHQGLQALTACLSDSLTTKVGCIWQNAGRATTSDALGVVTRAVHKCISCAHQGMLCLPLRLPIFYRSTSTEALILFLFHVCGENCHRCAQLGLKFELSRESSSFLF